MANPLGQAHTWGTDSTYPTDEVDKRKQEVSQIIHALREIRIGGAIADADAMIVLSHGKGHGHSGFGGAIKNIAMGCVDAKTRSQIHRLMSAQFQWNKAKCSGCLMCRDNCPGDAITFDKGELSTPSPQSVLQPTQEIMVLLSSMR